MVTYKIELIFLPSILAEAKEEHKCVIRLLTMALGTNETRAEHMISPTHDAKRMRRTENDPLDD